MDTTISVTDGTTVNVFAVVDMTTGRSVRTSRQADVGTPVNLTIQHSTKKGITRSNAKIDYNYTDSLGMLRRASESYTHTWERNLVPADVSLKARTLLKNFISDATLMGQFDRAEL